MQTGDLYGILKRSAKDVVPEPGGWIYLVALLVALVSPWLWVIALVSWPVLAHVLPRHVDDAGNKSRRWGLAFLLAFALGYVVAYPMVVVGFHIAVPLARAALE
jgi:hypothetical protein